MAKYAYNPYTFEIIRAENPSDWMGTTSVAPPEFDPDTAGCFWRGDHWEIVPGEVPSNPVPEVVTMRQARLALLSEGLLSQVNDIVANMQGSDGDIARIEWEFAQNVRRYSPFVVAISATLGLTDEDLNNIYKTAAGL